MQTDAALAGYYARRACEYERIYEKPERQRDLATLARLLQTALAGHEILEVACGTGYWTQVVARTAKSILATDINEEVLQLARAKDYARCPVIFQRADAFQPGQFPGGLFTAGLAAAWWSHLKRSEQAKFLAEFHRVLRPGALVVMMDNRFVPGSSTPVSRADGEGNTYQSRFLDNGEVHEVIKNFPSKIEMVKALEGLADDVCWTELPYYWFLTYRTK